jgi:transposase InsO family protein
MNFGTPKAVEYTARHFVSLRRQVVMPIGQVATETMDRPKSWRLDYNEERPHSAIGNKVPAALVKSAGASSPSA